MVQQMAKYVASTTTTVAATIWPTRTRKSALGNHIYFNDEPHDLLCSAGRKKDNRGFAGTPPQRLTLPSRAKLPLETAKSRLVAGTELMV